MRKLFLSILAFLFLVGIANAAGIPTGADPQNAPEVWTMSVYNNNATDLTSGSVVVWAMSSDTTDTNYAYRTMWVDDTVTADDINVAGVVLNDTCVAKNTCTIAVYGPVYAVANDSTDAVTADNVVGTTTTAGRIGGAAAGANSGILGWAISSSAIDKAYGGYGGTAANDNVMIPVFVNPTPATN